MEGKSARMPSACPTHKIHAHNNLCSIESCCDWSGVLSTLFSCHRFAIAEEQQVGLKPKTMSFSDAGTLPLVGFTTLQALRETGAPWANKPNLTVLVTAGAGGTGFIALQLARAYGAVRIVTAASKDQIAFCQQMGATQVSSSRRRAQFVY